MPSVAAGEVVSAVRLLDGMAVALANEANDSRDEIYERLAFLLADVLDARDFLTGLTGGG